MTKKNMLKKESRIKADRHSELVSESIKNKEYHAAGFRIKSGMTESGRSMVEMLGVLAVIGVLSVAGIAGYTTAMRSYRTNEIVNAASMLYVMAQAQNAGNGATGDVTYASFNNGTNPSGVSSITYTDGSISINFNTKEDCDAAKLKLGDKAGECPATATDGAYPLTVTLGEANQDTQTPIEPECTTGNYKCEEGEAPLYKCVNGAWERYCSCMDGCNHPDEEASNISDVCMTADIYCG